MSIFRVGEVFHDAPVLEGTDGLLHATGVYLEGLFFKDLEIRFENGRAVSMPAPISKAKKRTKIHKRKHSLSS